MDEKLKNFVNSIGAMVEVWAITYRTFLVQGFSMEEALDHTIALITTILTTINFGGEKDAEN